MKTPETQFQVFTSPDTQAMIAECGFRVADYLHEEMIGSLVLVDQAARNLYIPVREAYKQAYPDEKVPGVYFLNPGGFLSPDIHPKRDYDNESAKKLAGDARVSDVELEMMMKLDPTIRQLIAARSELTRRYDQSHDKRRANAEQLTPMVGRVALHDETFNSRVLILDACMHDGGSIRGIETALKDVGVIDVRTGVVNNISNRAEDPNFVVFGDHEIRDICKPFGTQHGLLHGDELISKVGPEGLSYIAKLSKRELYAIMENARALRAEFKNPTARRPRHEDTLLSALETLLSQLDFGPEIQIIGDFRGGSIDLGLGGTEYGSAYFVDDDIYGPEH